MSFTARSILSFALDSLAEIGNFAADVVQNPEGLKEAIREEVARAKMDEVDYGIKGLYTFRSNSFSPHGTCRMGVDPYQSVVSPTGELHDTPGLFVADSSLIPESISAPIQWTVQALAKYVSDQINDNAANYFIG